jgi:hypothetical protein
MTHFFYSSIIPIPPKYHPQLDEFFLGEPNWHVGWFAPSRAFTSAVDIDDLLGTNLLTMVAKKKNGVFVKSKQPNVKPIV